MIEQLSRGPQKIWLDYSLGDYIQLGKIIYLHFGEIRKPQVTIYLKSTLNNSEVSYDMGFWTLLKMRIQC